MMQVGRVREIITATSTQLLRWQSQLPLASCGSFFTARNSIQPLAGGSGSSRRRSLLFIVVVSHCECVFDSIRSPLFVVQSFERYVETEAFGSAPRSGRRSDLHRWRLYKKLVPFLSSDAVTNGSSSLDD